MSWKQNGCVKTFDSPHQYKSTNELPICTIDMGAQIDEDKPDLEDYFPMSYITEEKPLIANIYKCHPYAKLPQQATSGSVGWDIYTIDSANIWPGTQAILRTGLIVQPPAGFHFRVYARSGFGMKYNVGIPHGCGIIDSDYCGTEDELKVVLFRPWYTTKQEPLEINQGDRVAQLILEKTFDLKWNTLDKPPINQSRSGFGSTGTK